MNVDVAELWLEVYFIVLCRICSCCFHNKEPGLRMRQARA